MVHLSEYFHCLYLCVSAESLHSSVRPPSGHSLYSSMVVLSFSDLVAISSQVRGLSSGSFNLYYHILVGVCI